MSSPERPEPRSSDWRESLRDASPYLGLGMQLAFAMAFFTIGGYLLDRWLATLPWLTVLGGILGMVAVFVQLVRVSKQVGSHSSRRPPSRHGAGEGGRGGPP